MERIKERSVLFHKLLIMILMVSFQLGPSIPLRAADGDQGNATATFLKLDPSAQSSAFGSAYLGRSGNLSSYFNPAGLGGIQSTSTVITQNDIFADISYRYLSVSTPVENLGGGLGLSVTNLDYGAQDRTRVQNNNPITGLGDFSAGDISFSTAYGAEVVDSVYLGAGLKYVQSQIAGFQDGTISGDIGLQFDADVPGLRFGLSGRNLFGGLRLNEKKDPLPELVEFGVNYNIAIVPKYHELKFGFGVGAARDSDEYSLTGLQYDLYRTVSFRVGHNGRNEADDGLTAGFGLQYRGIAVDYAYVPFGDLGRQQRFTLSYKFGQNKKSTQEEESSDQANTNRTIKTDWKDKFVQARYHFRSGEVRKAQKLLKQINARTETQAPVLFWLGRAEHKLGNDESARDHLRKVLEIDPKNEDARRILRKINDEPRKDSVQSLFNQARDDFQSAMYKSARKQLLRAHQIDSDRMDVLYWLSRSEYRLGMVDRSRNRLLRLLDRDPSYDPAWQAFFSTY